MAINNASQVERLLIGVWGWKFIRRLPPKVLKAFWNTFSSSNASTLKLSAPRKVSMVMKFLLVKYRGGSLITFARGFRPAVARETFCCIGRVAVPACAA